MEITRWIGRFHPYYSFYRSSSQAHACPISPALPCHERPCPLPWTLPALRQRWQPRLPGLLLVGLIAAASLYLAELPWLQAHGLSALTVAIVAGIVIGNTFYPRLAPSSAAGVGFSKHWLLRAGIVLYGLRLTFQDIGHVGVSGVLMDVLVVASTFGLACWLGVRVFKMEREAAMLIGAGSAICGAAAVMAAEPVVRGRAAQVTVAVSTVVVFGTLAMFLYPALYALVQSHGWLAMDARQYGLFTGATVHEVAQVVAAGRAVNEAAADTAVITKMVRVMLLAPFLIALSLWLARGARPAPTAARRASWCRGSRSVSWRWPVSTRCTCYRLACRRGWCSWIPCCWRWRWLRWV